MKFKTTTEIVWNGDEIIKDMKAELMDAFYSVGKKIVVDAKRRIHNVSGKLAESIRVRKARKEKYKPAAFIFAGNRRGGVYWHYMVEYGTYNKSAHPYIRPAVDSNFNAIKAEAARAGKRVINKKRREHVKAKLLAKR